MKLWLIAYTVLEVVLIALLVVFMVVETAHWALTALWGAMGLSTVVGGVLLVRSFKGPKKEEE